MRSGINQPTSCVLGSCEDVLIEGRRQKKDIIPGAVTVFCDEKNIFYQKNVLKYRMRETSKTYDRFRYDITNAHLYGDMDLYERTLESSKPSPVQFSVYMSSKSPTGSSSPSFYVLFTQDEPYSWVDIRMEVSSSRRNGDVSIFEITETISLLKQASP